VVRGLNPADRWRPPAELAAPAIARLFPHAPSGDPTDVLLYCCGRAALGEFATADTMAVGWDSQNVTRACAAKAERRHLTAN
jgi:hypothetical protein